MTNRSNTLRAVLATAVLATAAAARAAPTACDPMYPCYTDAGTPETVYDPAARTDDAPCQSYPCYPEQAKLASPIAAGAAAGIHTTDQSI